MSQVKQKLTDFLGEASIHGLNRVADSRRNFLERLIWSQFHQSFFEIKFSELNIGE